MQGTTLFFLKTENEALSLLKRLVDINNFSLFTKRLHHTLFHHELNYQVLGLPQLLKPLPV
jgi:hypothetical protein